MSLKAIHLEKDLQYLIPLLIEKVSELKKIGANIQAQPLGFLRLALSSSQLNAAAGIFLHVWSPNLPIQKGGPYKHTHVFNMRSKVLFGAVENINYYPVPNHDGDHELMQSICAQDHCSPLSSIGEKVVFKVRDRALVKPGEIYFVEKGSFHETQLADEVALTLIE